METNTILEVTNLKKYFPITKGIFFSKKIGYIKAVDNVTFQVNQGEIFGLVGESGCGKTTTGRLIMGLVEPTSGQIRYTGASVYYATDSTRESMLQTEEAMKQLQLIFQDPYSSLNPRMTIGQAICEPLIFHRILSKREAKQKAFQLLDLVGLSRHHFNRYPHEFSGGQRQRIVIARALGMEPKLVIADEPVAALDVSIRGQILNLMVELQNRFHLSYIFISHDLNIVRQISHRIAVMYLGKIVELAEADDLFNHPLHPYSKALFAAIPVINPKLRKKRLILKGETSTEAIRENACNFYPRCPKRQKRCSEEEPKLIELTGNHWVSCFFPEV